MRMDSRTDPSGGPFQGMLNAAYDQFATAGRAFEPWFKAAARGNLEAFALVTRRAQAYVELPARLGRCRSAQDLLEEQTRFWQTMMEQYAECSQKILQAWADVAKASSKSGQASKPQGDYMMVPEGDEKQEEAAERSERRAA